MRRAVRHGWGLFVISVGLLTRNAAAGEPQRRAVAPGGPGLDPLEVVLDESGPALKVHRCKTGACTDGDSSPERSRTLAIPIERSRLDLATAVFETVPIGDGKHVVHVRIADAQRKDLAFEAILAGNEGEPIFSGLTGYTRGEDGDRSGVAVLMYDRDDRSKFVIVAETREDTRICGQATTPLGARGLDPKSMQLRGATLHRLDKNARDAATNIDARPRPDARTPLARILFATGGSAPGTQALTDGKNETAWSEKRPGDGHGEFVTMRVPSEVPIHSLVVTILPSAPSASLPKVPSPIRSNGAAPRTLFLASDQKLFHVTLPEDAWLKPGASFEVPLPEPIRTSCLALVLDEAYTRNLSTPEVTVAEVAAMTKFDVDGASIDDVAKELSGPRADEAAAILKRGGDDGLAAIARRFPSLDSRARGFAVDVAESSGTCEGSAMDLLTRGLADKEAEVKKRSLGRVARCGKSATESLVLAMRSEDELRRAAVAPLLAAIAPGPALEAIGEQLGKGTPESRRALRGALGRASASAPRERLLALVSKKDLPASTRLDLLRALATKLPELRPESDSAIADVLRADPDMPTRFLIAQPLSQLARSSDATSGELTRLAELVRRDPEWPVRARAVELAAGIAPLTPMVVAAASDPEPRVREAALKAIASAKLDAGGNAAERAIAEDPWTFVRASAAETLGTLNASTERRRALATALGDPSVKVRSAAVIALGNQHAVEQADKIRERLDDGKEDVEVRALAARTLGTMCVRSATDRLTRLAELARSPVDEADERLGVAAIDALLTLHPPDLEKRLAPLRTKEVRLPLRRAAEHAVTNPGSCR